MAHNDAPALDYMLDGNDNSAAAVHESTPRSGVSETDSACWSQSNASSTRLYVDITAVELMKRDVATLARLSAAHRSVAAKFQLRHEWLLWMALVVSACIGGVALAQQAEYLCAGCDVAILVLVAAQSFLTVVGQQMKFQAKAVHHRASSDSIDKYSTSFQARIMSNESPRYVYDYTRDSIARVVEANPWPPGWTRDEDRDDFGTGIDARKFVEAKYRLRQARAMDEGTAAQTHDQAAASWLAVGAVNPNSNNLPSIPEHIV